MAIAWLNPPTRPPYIDHPASAHLQRLPGMAFRQDALIQADRRGKLRLQAAVIPQVIFGERLLDQQQVQIIQPSCRLVPISSE